MMIYSKALAQGNTLNLMAMNSQFDNLKAHRKHNMAKDALPANYIGNELAQAIGSAKGLATNAGLKPADLFREFDNTVVSQFRLDEGDAILNDLMPLSRSLPLARTVLENARSSDAGVFGQSMSGTQGTVFDNVDYDTDGTIVPINQNGFKRNFREGEQLGLEGFDDMMHQQREAVRTHRQGVVSSLLDGHRDKAGNFIIEKGYSWKGIRADNRVDQIDLGAGGLNINFATSTSGADIKAAFIALIKQRYVENKVMARATYYISNEVYFNFMQDYSAQYRDVSVLDVLKRDLAGQIADIKPSSALSGNQVMSIPLETRFIQPTVGMAVSTIARARPNWNDPLAFEIVSAIGWKVNTDFEDQGKALQYAAG